MCNKITSIALEPSQPLSGPTDLNLTGNRINSDGATALASSFRYMPHLEYLNITENLVGFEDFEPLFRELHHLQKLRQLSCKRFPRVRASGRENLREKSPSKLTKLTRRLTAVFQHSRKSPPPEKPPPPPPGSPPPPVGPPPQTLLQACVEGLKQKGIWRDGFYTYGVGRGALLTQHIQEIARVGAVYPNNMNKSSE